MAFAVVRRPAQSKSARQCSRAPARTASPSSLWQAADGYVAIERLNDPNPKSVHHYFTVPTVIIAAA